MGSALRSPSGVKRDYVKTSFYHNYYYCILVGRIVMTATRGLVDTTMQLACALAGTSGHSEYNYVSGETFTVGQMDTWYMKDEDGDGKDDYCRSVRRSNWYKVNRSQARVPNFTDLCPLASNSIDAP